MSEELSEKVKAIVADRMGVEPDQITEETHFINDLNADSLDLAELVIDLEEQFGIKISDEDAQKLTTVGEATAYLKEHYSE